MWDYGRFIDSHPSRVVYKETRNAYKEWETARRPDGSAIWLKAKPILVIPENPAARAAMVERVVKTFCTHLNPENRADYARGIEEILATALTP